MKITIAYLPGEEQRVSAIRLFVEKLLPGIKARESDRHAPYKHLYLASKKPNNKSSTT